MDQLGLGICERWTWTTAASAFSSAWVVQGTPGTKGCASIGGRAIATATRVSSSTEKCSLRHPTAHRQSGPTASPMTRLASRAPGPGPITAAPAPLGAEPMAAPIAEWLGSPRGSPRFASFGFRGTVGTATVAGTCILGAWGTAFRCSLSWRGTRRL